MQGRASLCKYGKCVRREKQECASPCRLEQGSCWILAGRTGGGGLRRVFGPSAALGPPGRQAAGGVPGNGLQNVRAKGPRALQGAQRDPGRSCVCEEVPGRGAAKVVGSASLQGATSKPREIRRRQRIRTRLNSMEQAMSARNRIIVRLPWTLPGAPRLDTCRPDPIPLRYNIVKPRFRIVK
jgi:hypothetical protein